MIETIMIVYLIVICAVSAVTDWKKGKIYNKWLKFGMIPGAIIVVYYYFMANGNLQLFLTNFFAAIVIAILFYSLKLWGAGDSKLWLFVNFLYPTGWYATINAMLFPSMLIFMIIFIEAYVYLIGESVWYRFVKREKAVRFETEAIKADQIWNLLFSIFFLSIIYSALNYILGKYYENNRIFFSVIGILLVNRLVTVEFQGKKFLTIIMAGGYTLYSIIVFNKTDIKTLILTILLVLVTHFSLKFANGYNYEWIRTRDVKEGMIMSYYAIQQFYGSRVKGLPSETDESTKSRISQDEANAIKRWEKSKYGKEEIMIVRYIPFAVFILIGMLTYLIGVYNLK